jgi:ABC-2 type transport system permease protein
MRINEITSPVVAIFKYSTKKILFNRRWLITLLMVLLVVGILGYAGSQDIDALDGGAGLMDIVILSFIMPIIAMIHGASLIRNEIDDRSITQVITAPLDRRIAYLGYYLALAVSLSLIMLLINISGWLAFFLQKGVDTDSFEILAAMSAMSVIGALVYSALFLATGVIFSKPVYFSLFYAFVWEAFIGSIPGAISKYTVKHFIRSLGSGWLNYGDIATYDGTSMGVSLAVIAGLTIVFLVLGAMIFKNKEYP